MFRSDAGIGSLNLPRKYIKTPILSHDRIGVTQNLKTWNLLYKLRSIQDKGMQISERFKIISDSRLLSL